MKEDFSLFKDKIKLLDLLHNKDFILLPLALLIWPFIWLFKYFQR